MKSAICSSSPLAAADRPGASAARRRRPRRAPPAPSDGTRPPAPSPGRFRTRSRTCACRDAHRCLEAFQVHRRCLSRRVCRRRSGTARPARRRNGETGLSQVHPRSLPTVVRTAPTRRSDGRSSARAAAAARPLPDGAGWLTSAYCPPTIPLTPVAAASSAAARSTRSGAARWWVSRWRNASAYSPSPARIATPSPNFTWQVGCPRRSSSSSIAGRSSWISE